MCEMGGWGVVVHVFHTHPLAIVTKFYLLRKSVRNKDGSNIVSLFNPSTPMSDQDRISPYNIITMSTDKW